MNPILTPSVLRDIAQQVVRDTGYEAGLRINTFATIDHFPDLRSAAFGKTYEEYIQGNYWARDWANGGADSQKMTAEFPALFFEWREIELEDPTMPRGTTPVNIYLVDKIKCDGCPDEELRTAEYLTETTNRTMRMFLTELFDYGLYEYEKDGETAWEWMSQGRNQYRESEGDIENSALIDDIQGSLIPGLTKIRQYTNLPDFRVAHTILNLEWCEQPAKNFNYKQPPIKTLAYTKCPC